MLFFEQLFLKERVLEKASHHCFQNVLGAKSVLGLGIIVFFYFLYSETKHSIFKNN